VTRCVRQSAFACVDLVSIFALPSSFFSPFPPFIIYPLFPPFLSLVFLPVLFFLLSSAWVENFQLAERRRVQHRSNFAWLPQALATRSSHAICSNQKLSISVAPIQRRTRVKLLLNNWAYSRKITPIKFDGTVFLSFYRKSVDCNLTTNVSERMWWNIISFAIFFYGRYHLIPLIYNQFYSFHFDDIFQLWISENLNVWGIS
jgi:hypothetical protein